MTHRESERDESPRRGVTQGAPPQKRTQDMDPSPERWCRARPWVPRKRETTEDYNPSDSKRHGAQERETTKRETTKINHKFKKKKTKLLDLTAFIA